MMMHCSRAPTSVLQHPACRQTEPSAASPATGMGRSDHLVAFQVLHYPLQARVQHKSRQHHTCR